MISVLEPTTMTLRSKLLNIPVTWSKMTFSIINELELQKMMMTHHDDTLLFCFSLVSRCCFLVSLFLLLVCKIVSTIIQHTIPYLKVVEGRSQQEEYGCRFIVELRSIITHHHRPGPAFPTLLGAWPARTSEYWSYRVAALWGRGPESAIIPKIISPVLLPKYRY